MQSSVARCGCAVRQDSYISNSATKESVSLSEEGAKAMAHAAHDRDHLATAGTRQRRSSLRGKGDLIRVHDFRGA